MLWVGLRSTRKSKSKNYRRYHDPITYRPNLLSTGSHKINWLDEISFVQELFHLIFYIILWHILVWNISIKYNSFEKDTVILYDTYGKFCITQTNCKSFCWGTVVRYPGTLGVMLLCRLSPYQDYWRHLSLIS